MLPAARRALQVAAVVALALAGLGARLLVARIRRRPPPDAAVRLRRTLERLGPTFMKLGQVLSTRPDIVPPAFEVELSKLQDSGPPVPWPEIERAVTRSLGRPPAACYRRFDRVPIAAASIGQVHAAQLDDGTEVVVKVRRPGVVDAIAVDLRLIRAVTRLAALLPMMRRFDPVGLSSEFGATITGELDYVREGRNAERLAEVLRDEPSLQIPVVCWDRTRDDVLTETRLVGAKIDDVVAIERAGLDRAAVARAFADAYLTMVFVHRFFHADPHPGNVFVRADGVIGFVDFGMVGAVDDATGRGLVAVLTALVAADASQLAGALVTLGVAGAADDRVELERELGHLLDRYGDVALQDLRLAEVVGDLMTVVRRRDLRLPSRIALLLKTVVMCEGVAARLDPGFRLVPLLVPYAALLGPGAAARDTG